MSGRPVPMGLRVLTPHGTVFYVDAAVASWARSDREQPSRRLLPGSWIAWSDHLRRIGVTKNWVRVNFLPRVGGGVAAPTLGQGATRRVSAVAICRLKPSSPNAHSPLVAARSASRKAASRGGPNSARYARRSAAERPSSRSSEWSVATGSAAAKAPAP
jgi:hypothetical protein